MGRGKRRIRAGARLKKQATCFVHGGPLTPEDQLHALLDDYSIQERLTAQYAGFTSMSILCEVTEPVERHGSGNEASDEDIRGINIGLVKT